MGLSESGSHGCKKHPNHQQNPGVCPSCLRERLSRLCSASYKEANSRVASSSSWSADYYYSASSSNSAASSPVSSRHRNPRKRNGLGLMGILGALSLSSSSVKVGTSNGLKKSRSIACIARNLDGDDDDEEAKNRKNKKKGFWSKLLRFKGKKDVLTHSTSMRLIK